MEQYIPSNLMVIYFSIYLGMTIEDYQLAGPGRRTLDVSRCL